MKRRPRIAARATSLASAFVQAIIPRQDDAFLQAALYHEAGIKEGECAFCGERASDVDHFRALVSGGRPSGYFHTADNLVPACGRCNHSKGAHPWREWITGNAKHSPMKRGIPDLEERVERLSAFEALADTTILTQAQLREQAGAAEWDAYWACLDKINNDLREADEAAVIIRDRLERAFLDRQNTTSV